jgi:integrase
MQSAPRGESALKPKYGKTRLDKFGHSPHYFIVGRILGTKNGKLRISTGTPNEAEAELVHARWKLDNHAAEKAEAEQPRIAPFLSWYYDTHASKIASWDAAKYTVPLLIECFGSYAVRDLITMDIVNEYKEQRLKDGKKPSTVNRELSVLRAALNLAHEKKILFDRPPVIKDIPQQKCDEEKTVTKTFTVQQLKQLVRLSKRFPALYRFVIIGIATEARPDAIMGLTPHQIDFDNDLIYLNPEKRKQTRKYRPVVPLPPALKPLLRAWIKEDNLGLKDPFVRAPRSGPHGINLSSLRYNWRQVVKDKKTGMGLEGHYILKSIRHTVATWLARKKVPEKERSIQIGHERVENRNKMTAVYEHGWDDPDYLQHACAAINELLQEVLRRDEDLKIVDLLAHRRMVA